MNKIVLLLAFVIAACGLRAQSLSPKVTGSTGGGRAAYAGGSLSYTVGEMSLISTYQTKGNTLTQGFQQPDQEVVSGLIEAAQDGTGSFVVYPCPASTQAWFGFQLSEAGKVSVLLFNSLGQIVAELYQNNYQSGKVIQQTNVSALPAGTYFAVMHFTSDKDGKKLELNRKIEVIK